MKMLIFLILLSILINALSQCPAYKSCFEFYDLTKTNSQTSNLCVAPYDCGYYQYENCTGYIDFGGCTTIKNASSYKIFTNLTLEINQTNNLFPKCPPITKKSEIHCLGGVSQLNISQDGCGYYTCSFCSSIGIITESSTCNWVSHDCNSEIYKNFSTCNEIMNFCPASHCNHTVMSKFYGWFENCNNPYSSSICSGKFCPSHDCNIKKNCGSLEISIETKELCTAINKYCLENSFGPLFFSNVSDEQPYGYYRCFYCNGLERLTLKFVNYTLVNYTINQTSAVLAYVGGFVLGAILIMILTYCFDQRFENETSEKIKEKQTVLQRLKISIKMKIEEINSQTYCAYLNKNHELFQMCVPHGWCSNKQTNKFLIFRVFLSKIIVYFSIALVFCGLDFFAKIKNSCFIYEDINILEQNFVDSGYHIDFPKFNWKAFILVFLLPKLISFPAEYAKAVIFRKNNKNNHWKLELIIFSIIVIEFIWVIILICSIYAAQKVENKIYIDNVDDKQKMYLIALGLVIATDWISNYLLILTQICLLKCIGHRYRKLPPQMPPKNITETKERLFI